MRARPTQSFSLESQESNSSEHHILMKGGKMVPVPVHGNRDLGPGLVASIARQTGVKLK